MDRILLHGLRFVQSCYGLTDNAAESLLSQFSQPSPIDNPVFLGLRWAERPEVVCGGPCISNDLSGFSINTFYQILVPLRVAAEFGCRAILFLGVMEESVINPHLHGRFRAVAHDLKQAARLLADQFGVELTLLDTSMLDVNRTIVELRRDLGIELKGENTRRIYTLDRRKPSGPPQYSPARCHAYERIIACHTYQGMRRLAASSQVLVVEDAEQFDVIPMAESFDRTGRVNYLGFVPLPNLDGSAPMFKTRGAQALFLNHSFGHAVEKLKSAPASIREFYAAASELLPPPAQSRIPEDFAAAAWASLGNAGIRAAD